jgi:hypothetical protein
MHDMGEMRNYLEKGLDIHVAGTKFLQGTRLFGWTGCDTNEINDISEAYNDFYKLAQQSDVYSSIDWKSQAAKEFWGATTGKTAIPDDRKEQIKRMSISISYEIFLT